MIWIRLVSSADDQRRHTLNMPQKPSSANNTHHSCDSSHRPPSPPYRVYLCVCVSCLPINCISQFAYALRALVINEFTGRTLPRTCIKDVFNTVKLNQLLSLKNACCALCVVPCCGPL